MSKDTNNHVDHSKANGKKIVDVQEQDSCAANCSAYWYGMVVGMVLFNGAYIAVNSLFQGDECELLGVDGFNDSGFAEVITNISN